MSKGNRSKLCKYLSRNRSNQYFDKVAGNNQRIVNGIVKGQTFATRGNKMENNIQQIVRAVVANLNALPPQQPSQNGSNINSNPTSNIHGNLAVQDELHCSFQIPRTSASGNNQSERPSQSEQFQSSTSNQAGIVSSIAAGFSSRGNYSNTRATTRPRRTNQSNNTGRFQPYSRGRSSTSNVEEPKICYKAVCFLPNSAWDYVPRGKVKIELIERGMFVDAWAVNKNWDEKELRNEVVMLCQSIWPDEDSETFE